MASDPAPGHDNDLPPMWQRRFAFFRRFGLPRSSPQAQEAYRILGLSQRMDVSANVLAFVFGPLYFVAKGMWRKGLVLLVVEFTVLMVLGILGVSEIWLRAIGVGFSVIATITANYAYFLHVTRASASWNPFEGFGHRTTF
jgi:hypothetical protein